jgi:hypothetical protein
MTQESQKNNAVLIFIAIIGVVGTIVASTIGVIGSYNIEKLRQESALTQIGLVAIVTQGGATQASMASTISAPTITPHPPTASPLPKYTSTSTPLPTAIPTQTPDPRLFWDDFENGIKPEWGMTGQNFIAANGNLISKGQLQANIGNDSWKNYRVSLYDVPWELFYNVTILVRVQDMDNYMKVHCGRYQEYRNCTWSRVINGKEQVFPGMPVYGKNSGTFTVEVDGNVYRLYSSAEMFFRFVDNTFTQGGVSLVITDGDFQLGGFDVVSLP